MLARFAAVRSNACCEYKSSRAAIIPPHRRSLRSLPCLRPSPKWWPISCTSTWVTMAPRPLRARPNSRGSGGGRARPCWAAVPGTGRQKWQTNTLEQAEQIEFCLDLHLVITSSVGKSATWMMRFSHRARKLLGQPGIGVRCQSLDLGQRGRRQPRAKPRDRQVGLSYQRSRTGAPRQPNRLTAAWKERPLIVTVGREMPKN